MKLLSVLLILFSAGFASAKTTGRMVGPFMLISLATNASDGSVDSTPQRLYELMNVPEKPSNLGPGKALSTEKRVLNFVCNNRGQNAYQCAINIHKTQFSQISPNKATFEVTGAAAQAIFNEFHTQNGGLSFRDEENMFAVESTPERFLIVFSTSGV